MRTMGTVEKPIEWLARLLPGDIATETPEGNWAVQERFINAFRAMVPLYDRSVRLAPGAVTGEAAQDAGSRQLESWLRLAGAPVRQLSPQQQGATLRSQAYDLREEQAMQRALAALDN